MKMVIQFCLLGAFAEHVSEQLNSAILFCQPVINGRGGEIMTPVYDLVRRADGKNVFSFPAGGRYLVDTSNGLQSMRPLMDDEIIFTVESAARFLKKIGYQVIPPAA